MRESPASALLFANRCSWQILGLLGDTVYPRRGCEPEINLFGGPNRDQSECRCLCAHGRGCLYHVLTRTALIRSPAKSVLSVQARKGWFEAAFAAGATTWAYDLGSVHSGCKHSFCDLRFRREAGRVEAVRVDVFFCGRRGCPF